ncbi:E1-E2 ATPase-domain-containing protein, partial [Mycena latifolia]
MSALGAIGSPRGSLDLPRSPTHTDDGASIITVPPSPTLSSHSSVHFQPPTSLALRDNEPELRSPSLLSPVDGRNTHQRKGSNATFASVSDVTGANHASRQDEELRHVKSNTTSVTRVASRSVSRANADSDTTTAISEKGKGKKDDESQGPAELATDTDPTPFHFRSDELAMMLDPKNLDTLQSFGGVEGLLDGLGTTSDIGLGDPGDGRPGAGVGASQREKGLSGEKSVDWNSKAAFAASLDARRRIYGENVLPRRATKSLLQLMYTALKHKVLVLLSIAAVVSLALGLFQDFKTPRPDNEPPIDWVEGVAIMVAIIIVVIVGSVNDSQKERQFQTLNDKKEERGVKVIRDGVEIVIDIKQVAVGDIALLEPGEIVPCDGVFLSGHNVKCDESGATGESDAIRKLSYDECMALRGTDGACHTDCFVVSGSKVLEGVGKYVVVAVGTKSFNGRIMLALREDAHTAPLNALAESVAKLGSNARVILLTTGLVLVNALPIRLF